MRGVNIYPGAIAIYLHPVMVGTVYISNVFFWYIQGQSKIVYYSRSFCTVCFMVLGHIINRTKCVVMQMPFWYNFLISIIKDGFSFLAIII